jgi:hypothetical protein
VSYLLGSFTRRCSHEEDRYGARSAWFDGWLRNPDAGCGAAQDKGFMRKGPHEVGCRDENLLVILRKEKGGFSTSRPFPLLHNSFRLAAV